MAERYYMGVYWPGRVEPVESYARRAASFFHALAEIDPSLARWFELGGSRAEALSRGVMTDQASLIELFRKKKYRRDGGGISFSAWNGAPDGESTSIRLSCGSDSGLGGDRCVMEFPSQGESRERVLSTPAIAQLLRASAMAWAPDWGIATSTAHRDMVSEVATLGTFVGWGMYFSDQWGQVPRLPELVRIEPVGSQGTLVMLTPERFTAGNAEHVALAGQVQAVFERAGLLKPLLPAEVQRPS